MGIINRSTLTDASVIFQTKWDEIWLNKPAESYQTYTEEMMVDSKSGEHIIMEAMPLVRESIGPKVYRDFRVSNQTWTVKQYERSFAIKRIDVVTDRTGMTERRISAFLQNPQNQIQGKIAFDHLVSNPTGYDGVSLYSASHPRGPAGANQSNTTSSALSFSTFKAAMVNQHELRDEEGESLNIMPNVLRVGPNLLQTAMDVTGSDRPIGVDNTGTIATSGVVAVDKLPNAYGGGQVTVVMDPRLVGDYHNYWFLDDTSRGPRPIALYTLRSPEPVEQTDMDSPGRFELDELRYSIEYDGVAVTGAWQVTYGGLVAA